MLNHQCSKVKNPCKICLQATSNKNGLQCQGACRKWVHFKCVNYTPGKISDIRAGIIKVTCPCPDCETTQPKEFLVDPPYTCTNNQCPANKPVKCSSQECPTNQRGRRQAPLVSFPEKPCSPPMTPQPRSRPISPQQSLQRSPQRSPPRLPPPTPPPSQNYTTQQKQYESNSPRKPQGPPRHRSHQRQSNSPPAGSPQRQASRPCFEPPKYDPSPNKSPSCSNLSEASDTGKYITCMSSSDSQIPQKPNETMMATLEDMCNTMGKLTCQIRDLMAKIMV